MPTIYRSMLRDGEKPRVGASAIMLGVRVPADVRPDHEGMVKIRSGGMSVAPAWRVLPPHRIPMRLSEQVPDARGKGNLACFRAGDGPFANGEFSATLNLRLDSATHGLVEPRSVLHIDDFQMALAATWPDWVIDEE